jgi:dihydroorotase
MFCIKNGRVIDPAREIDRIEDLYVHNSRIVASSDIGSSQSGEFEAIDASDCLVLPGLIDFHIHVNHYHTDFGIQPDAMTFPNGVTSVVDPGSTGPSNFEGFYKHVICASDTTIKSFVNVAAMGVSTTCYVENLDPAFYDIPHLEYIFERYSENILGLKLRVGKLHSGELGLKPLVATREIARRLNTTMCVHVVYPESPYEEILSYFDKGDILCHCFQSKGPHNIFDETGKIENAVWQARERGVIFDAAYGRTIHNYALILRALNEGFMPDIISTDLTRQGIYVRRPYSLLYVLASFLAMGMPLIEIFRAVTITPARLMRMEGQIGTLAPGALADVSILNLREKNVTFTDEFGNTITGKHFFIPQMTIKAGKIVFRQVDFAY